uniref:Histone acetyltransferase n=1 Tax=Steinernema glaseri TaxID=37863 RepID=A0A1I7YJ96_9BILA
MKVAEELAVQRAQHDELEAAVRGIQDFTKKEEDDDEEPAESPSPVKEIPPVPQMPEKVTYSIYYVHFLNSDRRLDTWLDRSKFIERKSPDIVVTAPAVPPGDGTAGTSYSSLMTRSQKRIHEEFNHVQKAYSDMDATTAALEKAHEEFTKIKNLETVVYGNYEIEVWYFSPFPEAVCKTGKLYICEFCLGYMDDEEEYVCHIRHSCKRRQPPGDEIYRCGNLSVFEVDGRTNKTYCQCLCLLSKLFMDHKTLYFDVDTFLFYILCEVDHRGAHLVGHFSKERNSINNLACIMILPPFQRKGYGKLLIQVSYALSTREGVIGTPEKPLSDLGKVSYRSYWWYVLLKLIEENKIEDITVSDLSRNSGIHHDDIVSTMQTVGMIKYWKGDYVVRTNKRIVDQIRSKMKVGGTPKLLLHDDLLRWTPKTSWHP